MIEEYLYLDKLKIINGIYVLEGDNTVSYPNESRELLNEIEDNSFWFNHRNKVIISVVERRLPKGSVFFDVGGGNGYVASALQRAGYEAVLFEPAIIGAEFAKKRNIEYIFCAFFDRHIIKKNSIPALGLFDVIEHIENDSGFLSEVYELMAEDGMIFITVPAYNKLWSKSDDRAGHFRRYNLEELKEKLEATGFTINYATYFFSVLLLAVYFFRVIPYKINKRNGKKKSEEKTKKQARKTHQNFFLSELLLKSEFNRIKQNKSLKFGGSVLIVAEKNEKKRKLQ